VFLNGKVFFDFTQPLGFGAMHWTIRVLTNETTTDDEAPVPAVVERPAHGLVMGACSATTGTRRIGMGHVRHANTVITFSQVSTSYFAVSQNLEVELPMECVLETSG